MIVHAYGKINWALNVVGVRPDGYHEMDMLMQSISLHDTLALERAEGLTLDGGVPGDLILKAADALNAHAGAHHGARMKLVKRIPSRAGLGGGSADCAAALVALNLLWKLRVPFDELLKIGAKLGADVPFCLMGGCARARGIGERLTPARGGDPVSLVIVQPGSGLSTPEMFQQWDAEQIHAEPADIEACAAALAASDLGTMRRASRNMLTPVAVRALPQIADSIQRMYELGAEFAAMSGSGSAVFGAFSNPKEAALASNELGAGAILCETMP